MIDWQDIAARLAQLAATAQPARLLSVTVPLPRIPAIALGEDWVFWQRPDRDVRLLGIGKAFNATSAGAGRFAALHAAQRGLMEGWRHAQDIPPLAFTGFAFASEGGAPLPNASLWVPELLLREQADSVTLTLSCAADQAEAALPRWQALWNKPARHSAASPAPSFHANSLADEAFLARGRAALAAIAGGRVDKLVLTRTQRVEAAGRIDPAAVLAELAAHHPACAIFGVGHAGAAFAGASPETLLALRGDRVEVDALAGTAWQDAARALGDDKNRREHDFVARAVVDALAELCADVTVPDAPEVMQLEALTHLRRRVTARWPADVGVFDLVARLHPTPAVGGAPTPAALDWLAAHHDTRGAWYTGGIGWIDAAGDGDIAVALRCGLFQGGTATLYAGAGFVAGSDPAQELAETEAKFAAMRAAIVASSAAAATAREDAA